MTARRPIHIAKRYWNIQTDVDAEGNTETITTPTLCDVVVVERSDLKTGSFSATGEYVGLEWPKRWATKRRLCDRCKVLAWEWLEQMLSVGMRETDHRP